MRLASSPRPWPIRLFTALLLVPGLWNFAVQIMAMPGDPRIGEEAYRIAQMSMLSAQLSVLLIPAAAIWFFASRIAKWIISVLSLGSLIWIIVQAVGGGQLERPLALWPAALLVTHLAFVLLFTKPARAWFAAQRTRDARTFD